MVKKYLGEQEVPGLKFLQNPAAASKEKDIGKILRIEGSDTSTDPILGTQASKRQDIIVPAKVEVLPPETTEEQLLTKLERDLRGFLSGSLSPNDFSGILGGLEAKFYHRHRERLARGLELDVRVLDLFYQRNQKALELLKQGFQMADLRRELIKLQRQQEIEMKKMAVENENLDADLAEARLRKKQALRDEAELERQEQEPPEREDFEI